MKPPIALADLSEKDWEAQLIGSANRPGLARQLGWRVYHTLRSKGSQPGYPDWTLVRERVLWIECKTETGRVSDAQKQWIRDLLTAGAEAYVLRPRHLDQAAIILRGFRADARFIEARRELDVYTRQAVDLKEVHAAA